MYLAIRDAAGQTRSLRVALVVDRFDGRGGAETFTRDLAAWLAARGADVHVIAREAAAARGPTTPTIHRIAARRGTLEFARAALRAARAIDADVSHDMGVAAGCDVFQSHVGSPEACQRGADLARPAWYRPVRRLVRSDRATRALTGAQFGAAESLFIALSRRGAADLTTLHGVSPARIRLVPNGVDTSRFHPAANRDAGAAIRRRLGFAPDDVVVLAVAHNRRLKGIPQLIRAVRRLQREGAPLKLLVCGGPGARTTPPGAPIVEAGCVPGMAAWYAAADVAVQQTYYDACRLATLESLASGLPVITTRCNCASELVTPGVDAVVLDDPGDVVALTGSLRRLAADRWLRASLGRAARRRAEDLGVDAAFSALVAVYGEVVAARGERLVVDAPAARRRAA